MILNARQNGFVFFFPPDYFSDAVKEKYKKYYQSLVLPYDTIEDFMSSTIQSIEFPGWAITPVAQTRTLGKRQEYKSSVQVVDTFTRKFTLTFKMTDSYLNYFIFLDNALNFLDFSNKKQTFSPMSLSMLNNEGYLVSTLVFKEPLLISQDSVKLSYSAAAPDFKTFTATYQYFDFSIDTTFND
jgi:hypothetical protein